MNSRCTAPATSPGRCPVNRKRLQRVGNVNSSDALLAGCIERTPQHPQLGVGERAGRGAFLGALLQAGDGVRIEQFLLDGPIEHRADDRLRSVRLNGRRALHVVQKGDDVPAGDRRRLFLSESLAGAAEPLLVVLPRCFARLGVVVEVAFREPVKGEGVAGGIAMPAAAQLRVAAIDNLGADPGGAVAGIRQGKPGCAPERHALVLFAALARPVAEGP